MTSLYNLSSDYSILLNKEELDDDDMANLDQLHDQIEDKVIQCAYVVKELEMRLNGTKEALKIGKFKQDRIEKKLERLKEYITDHMVRNCINCVDKHPLFDVMVKQNPVSVDDFEPESIPLTYFNKKEKFELDKKRVKEDIENLGLVIPGVRLIRKMSLHIK